MAKFDFKKATISLCDGRRYTLTNQNITYVLTTRHHGTRPKPTLRIIDPATNNAALSITVTDYDIVVSLATDGSGNETTTQAQLLAALLDSTDVTDKFTISGPSADSSLVTALTQTEFLDGPRSISIKVSEGDLTWTESSPVEFTLDRGRLDTVRAADEEPLQYSIDSVLEFYSSPDGATVPTVQEFVSHTGPAANYTTVAADQCSPWAFDIEVKYEAGCGDGTVEYLTIPEAYSETKEFSLSNSTFVISGRANSVRILSERLNVA